MSSIFIYYYYTATLARDYANVRLAKSVPQATAEAEAKEAEMRNVMCTRG